MKRSLNKSELESVLERVRPFTMITTESLMDLAFQVEHVLTQDIPGDFVECGVWRGGASFLMAELLQRAGATDRKVWLFDSFDGLPPPTQIDGPAAIHYTEHTDSPSYFDNCRASLDDVRRAAADLGVTSHTEFVKGWFDQTLSTARARIGPIALLRIDCDWYDSLRCCSENLYDQVADRGFIVLDDYYTWDGCAIAVHEFLGKRGLPNRIESSPAGSIYASAVIRKSAATWSWDYSIQLSAREIENLVGPQDIYILVDEETLRGAGYAAGRALPFLERDGQYWGAPPDDNTAIHELDRLRRRGAGWIVFLWPAFWWLDYYQGFRAHLESNFQCVLRNTRLVAYSLRS
jgi:hypothetical protein